MGSLRVPAQSRGAQVPALIPVRFPLLCWFPALDLFLQGFPFLGDVRPHELQMFPLPPERCVPSGWSPHSPGRAAAAELFPGQGVRSALKYQVKAANGSWLARNSAQTKQQEQWVCQPATAVGSFWGSRAVTELCMPACPQGAGGKVQCPGLTRGEKILQPQGEKHEEKQTRVFIMAGTLTAVGLLAWAHSQTPSQLVQPKIPRMNGQSGCLLDIYLTAHGDFRPSHPVMLLQASLKALHAQDVQTSVSPPFPGSIKGV